MRSILRSAVLGALILALSSSAFSTGPDSKTNRPSVGDTIAAIIDAYGGEAALRSLRGYHARGVQLAVSTHAIIRVERWFASPDRMRLELAYPGHHETRYAEGLKAWKGSSVKELQPAELMQLQAMRMQAARFDLPLRLLDHASNVVLRRPDNEGRVVLRVPIGAGQKLHCHVNQETFRIEMVSMWIPGPPPILLVVSYEKFSRIDGALVPFAEITYMGSRLTSRLEMYEFEWNPVGLEAALQRAAAGATL